MDYNNHSIPLSKLTSTDVNKAIQRSLTKAIARHGLGLYIYAGEDIPDASDDAAREEVNKAIGEGFDQDLEVAVHDLRAAKSRKEITEVNARYRNVYGKYAQQPNKRYLAVLEEVCKRYPASTSTPTK